MRAQGLGILEPERTNICCAPSFVSVYAHLLLLDCVQQVIIFMSNVLAVQSDSPTPPTIYYRHNWAVILSLICIMYICYLRPPGADVRWCYSHSKHTFSSSLAIPGISLFPIKGDENGKSDLTTIRASVKYIIVGNFRRIGRGLNSVLPEGA